MGKEKEISLDLIVPDPNQPRKVKPEEYLQELGNSIKSEGLQSAITVRKHPTDSKKFMVVFGECRYLGSKIVGLETIRCIVREFVDEREIFTSQIVENVARMNMRPMEEADSFRRALLLGVPIEDLSEKTGKTVSIIAANAEMAGIADPVMRRAINDGHVAITVGRELAKFPQHHIRAAFKTLTGKTTARQMLAALETFRVKCGQVTLGGAFDHTQDRKELKKDLAHAGKSWEAWAKRTSLLLNDIAGAKKEVDLPRIVKAKEKRLDEVKALVKSAQHMLTQLTNEISIHEAQVEQKHTIVRKAA